MPFRSEAQRKYMYAKHPAMAKRWEEHTTSAPLPEKAPVIKKAYDEGVAEALARFGFKQAAEEIRLKIPKRQYHGLDAAFKPRTKALKQANDEPLAPQASPDQPAEMLATLLQSLDVPKGPMDSDAKRDPTTRTVAWSSPMDCSKGAV